MMSSVLPNIADAAEKTFRGPEGRPAALAFVTDAESEGVLRAALPDLTTDAVIRGDITKAVKQLSRGRSPRLLIVDVGDIPLPVSEVHNLSDVCEPGVHVIVIGTRNDVGLYRDLLQAGVTDYIVKPLTPSLVAKALETATHGPDVSPISRKLGKLVAFVGARGGVGASTLAVNLAWYLANQQTRRVALVDFDLQGGVCNLLLNIKPSRGLRDALENPSRIDTLFLERTMTPHSERLFVLGSEEPFQDEMFVSAEAAETLIDALRDQFHYVIADIPRLPSAAHRRVLDMASSRAVVVDQTLAAVRDAARLHRLLRLGDGGRHDLVVVNRRGEAGRRAVGVEQMAGALEFPVSRTVPFLPAVFAIAAARGDIPVARRGRFADAIAEIADEISGRPPTTRAWWSFGR